MTTVLSALHFNMSGIRRRIEPALPPTNTQPEPRRQRAVRRNLFGAVDHEENAKFVQNELAKLAEADARKWNFDFTTGKPMEGRFSWEPAKKDVVPSAYEMPNFTASINFPTASISSPEEDLSKEVEELTAISDHRCRSPVQLTSSVPDIIKPIVTKSITISASQPIKQSPKTKVVQPKITEYMKSVKRPRSASECKNDDEPSSSPLVKRVRLASS